MTVSLRTCFFHASPDVPGGGATLFSDIAFQEVGDYISVPGGVYDLEVVVSGTDTVALSIPDFGVSNNAVYTVFATGVVGDGTLNAVPVVDAVPAPGALGLLGVAGLAAARRRR